MDLHTASLFPSSARDWPGFVLSIATVFIVSSVTTMSGLEKILLSVLILLIAIATQLDFGDNSVLVARTAHLSLATERCYEKFADFNEYPEWMALISDVDNFLSKELAVGTEFTTLTKFGFLGTFQQRNVVVSLTRNRQLSFSTESLIRTQTDFNISASDSTKCLLHVTVRTLQDNLLFRRVLVPLLRLYYEHWATQSLMTLKMKL